MKEHQKLSEFASKIHYLFGLREQGCGLIALATEAVGCGQGCLLFLSLGGEDFTVPYCSPESADNPFTNLILSQDNPIVTYLSREKKLLVRENLAALPEFSSLRDQGAEKHLPDEIELLLPVISRDRLIAILVLGEKTSGKYSTEDCNLLEEILGRVAVSLEKEYLREQLSQLYAEVEEKARIDGLTGLLNRRSLDETIESEINRYSRYGGIFSLIIFDIDSLKTINDNHGHQAGDELLKQVGSVSKKVIRTSDQAFRYGGDEFAILLPNASIDAAKRVAERIRKQIDLMMIAGDTSFTASLGLASWPVNGRSVDEIIAAADAALYQAKRNGGNQSQPATNA
ncbi:MAG: sensor domain-containing diguanylate cyclase [Dehalococcoidales bacterium]